MIEELLEQLIERLDNRYFGKFRGFVHNNQDPEDLGRIQAIVPRLFDSKTPTGWALPAAPFAGPDQGFYAVPDKGAAVWIEFEEGDLSRPIWSGGWWGKQTPADVGVPGATAPRETRAVSELPQHELADSPKGPGPVATPGVRILKSRTGHRIVLDDRDGHARIEIHDAFGNRIVMNHEGIKRHTSNERTDNLGKREAEITATDDLYVAEKRTLDVGGLKHTIRGDQEVVIDGTLVERVKGSGYVRKATSKGTQMEYGGGLNEVVRGAAVRRVTGAHQITATGGIGVNAGWGLSMTSLGPVELRGTIPALPSLDTVSVEAVLGNVNINTKLGFLTLGGLTATSPLVLGDGLMIQHSMLGLLSRGFFSPASLIYGPLVDVWGALTLPMSLSLFARVKRYPFG